MYYIMWQYACIFLAPTADAAAQLKPMHLMSDYERANEPKEKKNTEEFVRNQGKTYKMEN